MKYLILASIIFLNSANAMASDCGRASIADMGWSSATLMANIDHFILKNGYNCKVELVLGDTIPTSTSMIEKGQPDIVPQLFSNTIRKILDKGVAEKRLRYAGDALSEGGEEGFWVPKYLLKKYPEITTIAGVVKNAALFKNPEDPERSAFYGCPAGWMCQITAGNLYKALKLKDAGFDLIDPGSGAGLAGSLAKAYERKEPWFGWYWAPSAILSKYKMVKVDFGTGVNEDEYVNCISDVNCLNPKVTMYPPTVAQTITTESFAARAPEAYKYLANRSFKNAEMGKLLAWMENNQADGEVAMEHFLTEYKNIWQPWVSPEVAKKINKALDEL